MSSLSTVNGIKFEMGRDKDSTESRIARGVQVGSLATQSTLYQDLEVKAGVDAVVGDTAALKAGADALAAAAAALQKARTALAVLRTSWDRSYDLLLAAGEKHCAGVDDGAGLGLVARPRTSYAFAMPEGISARHDASRDALRIHVERAPGTHTLCVQVRSPGSEPEAWIELDGGGAVHRIEHPARGTWQVRAASRSARAKSDFTTPVSVIVK